MAHCIGFLSGEYLHGAPITTKQCRDNLKNKRRSGANRRSFSPLIGFATPGVGTRTLSLSLTSDAITENQGRTYF